MNSLQTELAALTSDYTHRIVAVVQRAISDAVSSSIRSGAAPKVAKAAPRAAAPKAHKAAKPATAAKASPMKAVAAKPAAKAGKRSKGQKRAPEEIAATTSALLAFVKSHSGQRIEQIAKAMKVTTKDLALPAKKLLGDRKLKTRGQKRATQYFSALAKLASRWRGGAPSRRAPDA